MRQKMGFFRARNKQIRITLVLGGYLTASQLTDREWSQLAALR